MFVKTAFLRKKVFFSKLCPLAKSLIFAGGFSLKKLGESNI